MTLQRLPSRTNRGKAPVGPTVVPRSPWHRMVLLAAIGLAAIACNDDGSGNDEGSGTTAGSTTDGGPGTDTMPAPGVDSTSSGGDETTGSTGSSSSDSDSGDSGTSECGDLSRDPTNCGFCGHDCGGTACVEGHCEPTVYESSGIAPQDLALTDDYLFWMDYSAALLRCDIGGCPDGPEVFSPHLRVASVSVHDEVVYFGSFETDEMLSCPTSGCEGAPTLISAVPDPYGAYALDDTVYFMTGTDVVFCPTSGCDGAPTVMATGVEPLAIQIIGDWLFYSDRMGDEIRRCDLPACEGGSTLVAPEQDGVLHLRSYGDHMYWVNQAGGEVRRCDPADCAATIETLATDQDGPTKLTVDDDGLYWVNFGEIQGSVAGCTDHTCSEGPVSFAVDQLGAVAIQSDEDNIYWVTFGTGFGGGGVFSVPK